MLWGEHMLMWLKLISGARSSRERKRRFSRHQGWTSPQRTEKTTASVQLILALIDGGLPGSQHAQLFVLSFSDLLTDAMKTTESIQVRENDNPLPFLPLASESLLCEEVSLQDLLLFKLLDVGAQSLDCLSGVESFLDRLWK